MSLSVRLAGDLPALQKSFFRNFVAMMAALFVLIRNHDSFRPTRGCLPGLLARSTFGTLGLLANFYAVDRLVLADASILNKMSPFAAALFSVIILKERLSLKQFATILTAFIGALFVIRPTFGSMVSLPAFVGFAGGVCAGIAYTFVRYLTKKGENKPFIIFFFSTFSTLVIIPFMLMDLKPMTLRQLLILLLAGLFATGGQFSITAAYANAPAREISLFDYTQIIFSTSLGFIFLGQVPDVLSFVGYLIIIGAAIWSWFINNHSEPQGSSHTAR